MATEVIYDVGGGANHHANLTLFEGARQGELVVADEIRTARVFAYNDTSRPTFDGSTTNAACFMRVIPDATARHAGKWDDTKFRMDVVASYSAALTISDPYVQVIGLQEIGRASCRERV